MRIKTFVTLDKAKGNLVKKKRYKVKVKFTIKQAMEAQRRSRNIALLFL